MEDNFLLFVLFRVLIIILILVLFARLSSHIGAVVLMEETTTSPWRQQFSSWWRSRGASLLTKLRRSRTTGNTSNSGPIRRTRP